jgi:hypothetical protein
MEYCEKREELEKKIKKVMKKKNQRDSKEIVTQ